MSEQLVLAIEPDLRQAAIVKRIVREKALADVAVVDSRDAAIEAMRTCMPDVLLLSALLSPRDEDELIAHLKTLDNAGHLQTHTIPQLASALQPGEGRGARGLLSAFRKKKDPGPANGCDPDLFADEIRVFLKRAAEKKRELQDSDHAAPDMRPSPAGANKVEAPVVGEPSAPQASSWSSPFEWKPGASWSRSAPNPEPPAAEFVAPIASPEPLIPQPPFPISSEPLIPQPPFPISSEPLIPESKAAFAAFAEPSVVAELAIPEPVSLAAESAPSVPEPHAAVAESTVVMPEPPAPILDPPSPMPAPEPTVVAAPEAAVVSARKDAGSSKKDPGSWKKDAGLPLRDSGSAIRDEGLVALGFAPLGLWVRREGDAPESADGRADVRALLSTLAVPRAVAAVSYPRGCRIRRVRVPAIPDADGPEAAAAVIASRGAAADHRDRRPSA